MSKRRQEPQDDPDPKITSHRYVRLSSDHDNITLAHLEELVRQARQRNFADSAAVRIVALRTITYFQSEITIGDGQ